MISNREEKLLTQAVIDEPIVGNKSTKSVDAAVIFAIHNAPTISNHLVGGNHDQVEYSLKACKTKGPAIDTFRSKHHPYPKQQAANATLVKIVMRNRATSIG